MCGIDVVGRIDDILEMLDAVDSQPKDKIVASLARKHDLKLTEVYGELEDLKDEINRIERGE